MRQQQFAFDIFQRVANSADHQKDNLCFSPLSAEMALSMAQNGAAGNTLAEMQTAMHTDGFSCEEVNIYNQQLSGILTKRPSFEYNPKEYATEEEARKQYEWKYPLCELANSAWAAPDITMLESFQKTLRTYYDAGIGNVDFCTQEGIDEVNNWVNEKTHNLIPRIFDEPQSDDLAIVLANTLYFKGNWTKPFAPDSTQARPFNQADGTVVEAEMMRTIGKFAIGETHSFRTAKMPYGQDGKFTMTLFVPIDGVELPTLTYDEWKEGTSPEEYTPIDLQLPRFYVEGRYDLKDVLIEMGMVDAFDGSLADFSNMSDQALRVSKVYQCSKIVVDEMGTEATAVSVVEMGKVTTPKPEGTFLVDRPFYFTIEGKDALLFVGRVNLLHGTARIATPSTTAPRDGGIYDLQGRRLTQAPAKGIFIQNGKKVISL